MSEPAERFKAELDQIWNTSEIVGRDVAETTRARYAWSAMAVAKLVQELGMDFDISMHFMRAFDALQGLDRGIGHWAFKPRGKGRGNRPRRGEIWEARAFAVIAYELYRAAKLTEKDASAKFEVRRSADKALSPRP